MSSHLRKRERFLSKPAFPIILQCFHNTQTHPEQRACGQRGCSSQALWRSLFRAFHPQMHLMGRCNSSGCYARIKCVAPHQNSFKTHLKTVFFFCQRDSLSSLEQSGFSMCMDVKRALPAKPFSLNVHVLALDFTEQSGCSSSTISG